MRTAEPLTLEQAAKRAGAWAWAERNLYEVLGTWAPSTKGPATKLYFDCCSQHHAWRTSLWRERLAGLVQAQPGSLPQPSPGLLGPPSRAAEEAMRALGALEDDEGRLATYCRVALPRVAAGYRRWLRACSASCDAPIRRTIKIVLADLQADWQEGCDLLVATLDEKGEVAVAAVAGSSGAVERLWAGRMFW